MSGAPESVRGRLIVAARWAGDAAVGAPALATRVRAIVDEASSRAGVLVAVFADGAAFSFDPETMDDAMEVALSLGRAGSAQESVENGATPRWKVGVALGEIAAIHAGDGGGQLSVGPAIGRAWALARTALGGEVLVDTAAAEATGAALLSVGRRVANDRGKRVRAIVVDLAEPWRRDRGDAVEKIRQPRLTGREAVIQIATSIGGGGLTIVRAAPGFGGTRVLEEIAERAARALVVTPFGLSSEPLGALRIAFSRARSANPSASTSLSSAMSSAGGRLHPAHAGPSIGPHEIEQMRLLESATGIDVESASDLLSAWLGGPSDPEANDTPLLVLDDASRIDPATLAAIGLAASGAGAGFAVVARIDVGEPIPQAFAQLVVESEVTLKALMPHEATAVVVDACGGEQALAPEVRRRWTRRGAGVPLALVEALRHGLASGDLVSRDGVVSARAEKLSIGRALSPASWLSRRLTTLAIDRPHDAELVTALALAGGGLERRVFEEAVSDLGLATGAALDAAIARLAREGMLTVHPTPTDSWLTTATRTLREVAAARADEGTRRRIHGAFAGAFARLAKGLDRADGARHAALAGDHLGAAALAMRAADRARRSGLGQWAVQLDEFARAEGHDARPVHTAPSPPPAGAFATIRSPAPPRGAEVPVLIPAVRGAATVPATSDFDAVAAATPISDPADSYEPAPQPEEFASVLPPPQEPLAHARVAAVDLGPETFAATRHETIRTPPRVPPTAVASRGIPRPAPNAALPSPPRSNAPPPRPGPRPLTMPPRPAPKVEPVAGKTLVDDEEATGRVAVLPEHAPGVAPVPVPPAKPLARIALVKRMVPAREPPVADDAARATLPNVAPLVTPPARRSVPPPPFMGRPRIPAAEATAPAVAAPTEPTGERVADGPPTARAGFEADVDAAFADDEFDGRDTLELLVDVRRIAALADPTAPMRSDAGGVVAQPPSWLAKHRATLSTIASADSTVRMPPVFTPAGGAAIGPADLLAAGLGPPSGTWALGAPVPPVDFQHTSEPRVEVRIQDVAPDSDGFSSTAIPGFAIAARAALIRGDRALLEPLLVKLEASGARTCAIARLRALASSTRGDITTAVRFARRARRESTSVDERARSDLAYAIVLAYAGDRDGAILQALSALQLVRAERGSPAPLLEGERSVSPIAEGACRAVLARLLDAPSDAR